MIRPSIIKVIDNYKLLNINIFIVSIWDRFAQLFFVGPSKEFIFNPEKVKITLWNYTFTTLQDFEITRDFWNKKYIKDFLKEVNSETLSGIFDQYSLPKIDLKRIKRINPFQLLPVIDFVIIAIIVKLFWK